MDFGEVLGKAWRIIWKHKVLWIFGIFAGCSRGGGGGSGSGWRESRSFDPSNTGEMERYLQQATQWISEHWWVVAIGILVLILLTLLAILLGTIGKIGLIRGTFQADGGAEKLHFGDLFRGSMPFFWRVFLLSFLVGLAILVLALALGLLGVLTLGIGLLCIIPLLCVLIPALLVLGMVIQQANVAMVIENLSMMNGVRRGWDVLKKNVGPILLIWLITAVIGFVVSIVIALPMLVVAVPALIAFATSQGNLPTTALLISGLCFVLYLPVLIVAQGILAAYVESVWTLTFLRLTQPRESTGSPEVLAANA